MINGQRASDRRYILFTLVAIVANAYFWIDVLHLERLAYWVKIVPALMMILGTVGSLLSKGYLRAIGWIAILLYLVISLMTAFPSEDYRFGDPGTDPALLPLEVSNFAMAVRLCVGAGLSLLLAIFYKRLTVRVR